MYDMYVLLTCIVYLYYMVHVLQRLVDFFRLDLKELVTRLKSGVKVALIPRAATDTGAGTGARPSVNQTQTPKPLQKKVCEV